MSEQALPAGLGIMTVGYGSSRRICGSLAEGLEWQYARARDAYVRTGSGQAYADMLWFTGQLELERHRLTVLPEE